MIEIPHEKAPNHISVCQSTGNLCISSYTSVSVYRMSKKSLGVPKMEYIDFDELVEIQVGFNVSEVSLVENIIGCLSEKMVKVIQLSRLDVSSCNGSNRSSRSTRSGSNISSGEEALPVQASATVDGTKPRDFMLKCRQELTGGK